MTVRSVLLVEEGGVGGVADYTAELAAALASIGWRVEIATATDHRYPGDAGVCVHRLFPYVRAGGRLPALLRRARLSRMINGLTHLAAQLPMLRIARRCDLVHVQGGEWPPLGLVQALLLRMVRVPFVWTPHNTFDRGNVSHVRVREAIARYASAIVLHADSDLQAVSDAVRGRTTIIPHGQYGGLGRRDGEARRRQLPAPDSSGEMRILLFGQLREDKGVGDLLEAAADVDGVSVALVGEEKGALASAAALLADRRLSGRVTVREGFLPIEQAPAVFAAADVVALPYRQASASGVLMLAYGYGRPVIVYPVGGLPEYVTDGETGWLCARADPGALAQALVTARDGGPAEWRRRGENALRLAEERYSFDAVGRETAALYERLLAGPVFEH